MTHRTLAAAIAVATLSLSATGASAGTVTAVAVVSVVILAPGAIEPTQGLAFASVTKPRNAGSNTIALDATTSKVTLSGSGTATMTTGAVSAAKFKVAGQPGLAYSTSQSLVFTQPGLTGVSVSVPVASEGAAGVIPASGVQELRFGGGFAFNAATPAQVYAGQLSVTVNYN
jgi:hypothetical protein